MWWVCEVWGSISLYISRYFENKYNTTVWKTVSSRLRRGLYVEIIKLNWKMHSWWFIIYHRCRIQLCYPSACKNNIHLLMGRHVFWTKPVFRQIENTSMWLRTPLTRNPRGFFIKSQSSQPNVGSMLYQRQGRWYNVEPTLIYWFDVYLDSSGLTSLESVWVLNVFV